MSNFTLTIPTTPLNDAYHGGTSLFYRYMKFNVFFNCLDTEHRAGIPTVDVYFDADHLDLGRVGIVPDSKRMATEQGAYYAANIHLIEQLNKKKI